MKPITQCRQGNVWNAHKSNVSLLPLYIVAAVNRYNSTLASVVLAPQKSMNLSASHITMGSEILITVATQTARSIDCQNTAGCGRPWIYCTGVHQSHDSRNVIQRPKSIQQTKWLIHQLGLGLGLGLPTHPSFIAVPPVHQVTSSKHRRPFIGCEKLHDPANPMPTFPSSTLLRSI